MSKVALYCYVILVYSLYELVKECFKLVSKASHSHLSLDEDQMPCDLHLRGYAHWKRPDWNDEAKLKDPYQVLFASICTTELNEIDFWKDCWPQMTPKPRWREDDTSGKTADLKHLDQACKNLPTNPVAPFTKCLPPYQNGKLLFYFWPQYSGWKKEISSEDAT